MGSGSVHSAGTLAPHGHVPPSGRGPRRSPGCIGASVAESGLPAPGPPCGRYPPGVSSPHERQSTVRRAAAPVDPSLPPLLFQGQGPARRRLSRMEGQVRGIARMIEREEYCVDILQQTAALRAAVDALSILVLEDHVQGCVRTAAERGEADAYVDEVIDVVRRTLGRPVRADGRARPDAGLEPVLPAPRSGRPSGGAQAAPVGVDDMRPRTIGPADRPAPRCVRARIAPPPLVERRSRVPPRRGPGRRPGSVAPRPLPRRPGRRRFRRGALAELLDLLARTVGARRAAVLADGTTGGWRSASGRRRPGRGHRPRRLARRRAAPRTPAERAAAAAAPIASRSAPIRVATTDRWRETPPIRPGGRADLRPGRPSVSSPPMPSDAADSADHRLPRTLARHAAVALALVTHQLGDGTGAGRSPRPGDRALDRSCPPWPTSCARR